ncbi:MAG TPA: hypothetical protein VHB54_15160 [Mucilaginibacter sp.]|nr:hypothetical protein [Mucilaginibacter sp.]
MKKSILLSAAGLLLGTGVYAVPHETRHHNMDISMNKQMVSLIPLRDEPGIAVRVDKSMPETSMVIFYDNYGNPIFKDCLTYGPNNEKKYNLSQLGAGNYTIEVFSKGHDVKTHFYVYDKKRGKVIFVS